MNDSSFDLMNSPLIVFNTLNMLESLTRQRLFTWNETSNILKVTSLDNILYVEKLLIPAP